MKTAILLSGQSREVEEVWESFKTNLFNQFPNPDLFIYTSSAYPNSVLKSIHPKKYLIENQFQHTRIENKLRELGFYADHRIDPTIQQFYGLKRNWELMEEFEIENNFKYDLVIRTRPDLIYLRPITPEIVDLTKINNLHAPFAPTMSTEFAIGPREEMRKYYGIYNWLSGQGQYYLTKTNPRLNYPPDHKYNCDILMISYLVDYMKADLALQRLPADAHCPYKHYRIMTRHKKGEY